MLVTLEEIQGALSILIKKVSRREITEHQFFEAVKAMERHIRLNPKKDFSTFNLVRAALTGIS